ncbi:hypothetical protein KSF78_0003579 [Schistosoma japonicum]|nr:hypothetical protein KSF78_0003579 [Schistosoma japonicum]KAH8867012.1 hypothetical protein KSF78_0003579 [Schistosoma japonicum]
MRIHYYKDHNSLPMFSNQYMGTRPASRNLSRAASTTVYSQSGPYSRFNVQQPNQKPVNAKDNDDAESEEVDYSFMNLPVRERRKLFLGGSQPPTIQRGYMHSLTIPRKRNDVNNFHNRYETQSEYGGADHNFGWDAPVTPTWIRENRSGNTYEPVKSRSTKTFSLSTTPGEKSFQQQFTQYVAVSPSPRYNQNSPPASNYYNTTQPRSNYGKSYPQYSATVHVPDSYPTGNITPGRQYNGSTTRIYPVKQHSTYVPSTRPITPSAVYSSYNSYNSVSRVTGKVSQPLRVNVYNSDNTSTIYSPQRKIENSSNWNPSSPIYPAYPAYMDKSDHVDTQPLRYRREQSVRPVTIYATNNPTTNTTIETKQVWKAIPAQNWSDTQRTVRSGTFITTTKKISGGRRLDVNNDSSGVSEF